MAEPHIDVTPQSMLFSSLTTLSGHAIVAAILLYVMTSTLPDIVTRFERALESQRTYFGVLLTTEREERIRQANADRDARKELADAIKSLNSLLIDAHAKQ